MYLIIWQLDFLQHRGTNSGVRSWTASSIGTCQASIFPTSLNASHMEKSIQHFLSHASSLLSHCTPSQSKGQWSIIQGGGWGEQTFMDTVGIGVQESKASILHQTRLQNQDKTKCTLKYACCHLCFCVFFWKPLIKYLLKMFL